MQILRISSGIKYDLYERAEGKIGQVTEYISTLADNEQKQIVALFKFILEKGPPINKEKFRHLGDQIYELKTRTGIRILSFYGAPLLHNALILTHGLRKPKKKVLMREKEKTLKWREEFFRTANKANNFNILQEKL